MNRKVEAVYRGGAFVPITPVELPEETRVSLTVQNPSIEPPAVTDPEEWSRMMECLVDRMQRNPIPADAPRFTREELHDRR